MGINLLKDMPCFWFGSIESFLMTSEDNWLSTLCDKHKQSLGDEAGELQITAWCNCFNFDGKAFRPFWQIQRTGRKGLGLIWVYC